MKKRYDFLSKTWLLAVSALWMYGCTPSIKIQREFFDPEFAFKQVRADSRIKLFVAENIHAAEYLETYLQLYSSDRFFRLALQKQIEDTVRTVIGCPVEMSGDAGEASTLRAAGIERNTALSQQIFKGSTADFFLVVHSVEISRKIVINAPMMTSNPNNAGGTFTSSSETENCRAMISVDVWNVKARRKILSYSSTDESPVSGISYGVPFKAAVAGSIGYMVRYLKTGRLY